MVLQHRLRRGLFNLLMFIIELVFGFVNREIELTFGFMFIVDKCILKMQHI